MLIYCLHTLFDIIIYKVKETHHYSIKLAERTNGVFLCRRTSKSIEEFNYCTTWSTVEQYTNKLSLLVSLGFRLNEVYQSKN